MTYNISRYSKDGLEKRKLSKNKKWLPIKHKGKCCILSEKEVSDFIEQQGDKDKYYYLKTII